MIVESRPSALVKNAEVWPGWASDDVLKASFIVLEGETHAFTYGENNED